MSRHDGLSPWQTSVSTHLPHLSRAHAAGLALQATTLGQSFTVLTISLVYRGCAIPVAWQVAAATGKGAWRPHWLALFDHLQGSVPTTWTVVVLADRGLYARWLFTQIVACGWHPFLRINSSGHVRPLAAATVRPLRSLVPHTGSQWHGEVVCFSTPEAQLRCTLLGRWDAGHRELWLILTDLPAVSAEAA